MNMAAIRRDRRIALGLLCGVAATVLPGTTDAQSIGRSGVTPGLSQSLSGFGAPGTRDPLAPDPLARGEGFEPYIEGALRENLGEGSSRLFAELSPGLSAFINRDRAQGTLILRLTERAPVYGRNSRNQLLVEGVGRGQYDLVRNRLFFDLSTYADVVARDYAQGLAIRQADFNRNLTQVYYVGAGPRLQRDIGTLALLNARYNAAYTAIDNHLSGGSGLSGGVGAGGASGGGTGSGAGGTGLSLQPYSNSFSQTGEVSLSNQPRDGRFIVRLTGRVTGQEQERLKQTFRSHIGTSDLTYALSRPVSLLGSVGYEDYRSSQEAIKTQPLYLTSPFSVTTDPRRAYFLPGSTVAIGLFGPIYQYDRPNAPVATFTNPVFLGNPVVSNVLATAPNVIYTGKLGAGGSPVVVGQTQTIDPKTLDYVPDLTVPRQQTYAQKGLVWNAGFRYTPSRRSTLELRVGQRFADVTVTGIVRQEFRGGLIVTGALTDGIETFGTILTRLVDGVPVSFVSNGRGASFGAGPQSVSSGVFRSRIGTIGAQLNRGETSYGVEYVYSNRRYLDAGAAIAPGTLQIDQTLVRREDIVQTLNAHVSHRFGARQTLDGSAFVGLDNLGLTRGVKDQFVGGQARYDIRLRPKFNVFADAAVTQRFAGRRGGSAAVQPFLTRGQSYLFSSLALGARYHF